MSIKTKFSSRLSLYIVGFSALLLIAVMLLYSMFARSAIQNEARENTEKVLDNTILEIEKVITEVERAVDNVDWLVMRNLGDEKFLYEITREVVLANPNIIGSAIAFEPGYYKGKPYFAPYTFTNAETGTTRSFQMGSEQYDYPVLDWYQIPKLLDRPYWSEPYFDEGGGFQRMSTYSMPLRDAEGRFVGVITADISLEWLSHKVATLKPYEHSYTMLIGRNGTYIAHPDSSKVLNETIFSGQMISMDEQAIAQARDMLSGGRNFISYKYQGQGRFTLYGPLSNGWCLAMMCFYSDLYKVLSIMNWIMLSILVLGMTVLFLGSRRIIRYETKPIEDFSKAALSIAGGNFQTHIPEVKTEDELRDLRDSLSFMVRSINDYMVRLKSTTAAKERYESELGIARDIQMSLLPTDFPLIEGLQLCALVHPAREVGGDLYDFHIVGNTLYFAVGDVSGKGVPASLFMAIARAALRFVGAMGMSMAEVMSKVNDTLSDGNNAELFVTLFIAKLDLGTGEMTYCNAGHNPIVMLPPGGKAEFLRAKPNLAAGLFPGFPYQEESVTIAPGTRLCLYTDGVTEAERADKQQYGEERLLEWMSSQPGDRSAAESVANLLDSLNAFTEGAEQNDDITIMTIRWK